MRCNSSITISLTASRTRRRCSRCWRSISCRGGVLPDRTRCSICRSTHGPWCARAACAWRTSAPNPRAIGYCMTCARERARTRRWRRLKSAAVMASFRNCLSCWRRLTIRRGKPSELSTSSGTSSASTRKPKSCCTSMPRCRPLREARTLTSSALSPICATATARPWYSRLPQMAGPSLSGSLIGATPMCRGSTSACAAESATSPRCWGAGFPPSPTCARLPGANRPCARLASWRYRFQRYERPWELDFSKRFIRLWDPRVTGL